MNYTIEIYLYDNKLIFTGTRDLYFEKYKGNGPGVYSQPILCLPSSCSISEIQQALLTCVGVLEQNEKKILDENTSNSVTQMESVLFRNFKSFGIKASKSNECKEPEWRNDKFRNSNKHKLYFKGLYADGGSTSKRFIHSNSNRRFC